MKRFFFSLFLICLALASCKTSPPKGPVVKDPVFSITSIKILQAELINTRLKVHIRVENPNNFPVELLSITYELYGAGRLWTDGTESNPCTIPALGFLEKDLFLVMNFINMRRDLLDRIIAMRTVRYRFTGTAKLSAEALPAFTHAFNLEGESEVEQ
jgi:LEA14-like dessication related protein